MHSSFTFCFGKGNQFSSVQFCRSVDSLQLQGLQHTRLPCPSPTPRACSNPCPSSRWCHPTISFSVIPFSSRLQSFPASGSFPKSQFFNSGGQSIGAAASASVLPMNIQEWVPLGLTGLISLQSKGLSRVSPLPLDMGYLFWWDPIFSCQWLFSSELQFWSSCRRRWKRQ